MEKIVVTKELNNIRIDKYLADNTSYSRQTIIKMIKDGLVLVNDKKVKSCYLVKEDDVIVWDFIEKQSSNLEESNIHLKEAELIEKVTKSLKENIEQYLDFKSLDLSKIQPKKQDNKKTLDSLKKQKEEFFERVFS